MLDKQQNAKMLDKAATSYVTTQDYDVPVPHSTRYIKQVFAKALYDNTPDAPDELAFKKGDILTVLEQDTRGLSGWWLCTLRNRQGLCPGNRLRILNSFDSGCILLSSTSSPCSSPNASTSMLNYSLQTDSDIYENSAIAVANAAATAGNKDQVADMSSSQSAYHLNLQSTLQRQGTRRSWHVSPNKLITTQKYGDVYAYNYPTRAQTPLQFTNSQRSSQLINSNQSINSQSSNFTNMSSSNGSNEFENYDIPKPATPVNYDCPKSVICRTPTSFMSPASSQLRFDTMSLSSRIGCSTPIEEEYDVPRSLNTVLSQQNTLTPSSSNSSLLTGDSLSLSFSSSNRSSLANMPDYDIPRRNPLSVRAVHQLAAAHQQQQQQQLILLKQQQQHQQQQLLVQANCMTYDFPVASTQATTAAATTINTKELPLELASALDTLAKLQYETTGAITRLLSFVSPNWRLREKLEPVIMEVQLAAMRLRTALHDLTEFGEGALGNASHSEDRSLVLKLRPLVRALRDADALVQGTSNALDAHGGWTAEKLARHEDKTCKPPDSLDQLIACAQTLTEDVRQITSFIQGNASLLFRRSLPKTIDEVDNTAAIAAVTTEQDNNSSTISTPVASEWLEDYDYVSFESKDAAAKKNSALREAIPEKFKKNFDTALKTAETTAIGSSYTLPIPSRKQPELTDKDKQLVRYYAKQVSTHMGNLRQAIDSFLETVEKNQPPKYFIAYGKFVVVIAHNLVTIGDNVHRNISKADLKEKILQCTDALSDALKTCVTKSKKAAAHFPSGTAVQEMVNSVADISHLATDLQKAMLHAVHQCSL